MFIYQVGRLLLPLNPSKVMLRCTEKNLKKNERKKRGKREVLKKKDDIKKLDTIL